MQVGLPERVCFGAFEFDLRAGELRKGARKIRLQEQPFQVLRMLVEQRGAVVTREEIKKKLWPNDTVVEFDHSIQTAISKLRRALGDSADHPKYIETVARRGYRLMMKVEWQDDSCSAPAPAVAKERLDDLSDVIEEPQLLAGNLVGKKVSHYRLVEILGGGGMGVVYKAEDLRLGRQVAMKFLPEELGEDSKARERFEHEARAISALSHPNICPIYEFDEYAGQPFIVMELLHGKTLREHLADGAFQLNDHAGLNIAIQVATGLEAAHDKTIIHRDIKPANIFITEKNVAKILDFGVAKVLEADEAQEFTAGTNQEISPQFRAPNLTRTGLKLGTAGYMSPEQVRGEPLDRRTDIFSFGIVLYEMATGKRAFAGETAAALQASILNDTPKPVRELNPNIPHALERIIDKALEKDPDSRYQSAAAMSVELEMQSEQRHRKPRASRWWGTAVVLGIVLATASAVVRLWPSGSRLSSTKTLKGTIRSLAVLPLENVSGDPSQDYFADGMTDKLITDLGQIGSLRVISRTSGMQYKGTRKPLPEIAQELDVDAVVEGTVLRSGDQVRITAQLIQARADKHLWADSYQGDMRDVLALQNQVASAIVRQIRIKLSPEQQAAFENPRAINPEAYEAYLRGVSVSQKDTVDGFHQKIAYLEQALAKQPDYAAAHEGLADAYVELGHMVVLPPQEAFPRAKSEALKALQLDDSLAEAHGELAVVKFLFDWDFPGAEKEFQRALTLNPNSVVVHEGYADFLNAMGRPDEAIAERVRVRQIDPVSVSSGIGWEQYMARRYDQAIESARKVSAVNPNDQLAHLTLGLSLEQKHEYPEAIVELQKAADLSNDQMWVAFVAHAKAVGGDKAGARKILADLEALSRRTYVSPWLFAIVYPDLGEKDKAFFWLEKAYQGREHDLVFSNVWPMFDSLHSDPRYQDLMRRVGLPQ